MLKSATTNDLIFQAKRKGITVVKPFPKIFSRRSIYIYGKHEQTNTEKYNDFALYFLRISN